MPINNTPATSPTGCTSLNCFVIPLQTKPGEDAWNMIGFPFAGSQQLKFSRVVTTEGICVTGCTLIDTQTEGIVQNRLWNYNGTDYSSIDTNAGNLEPWKGYWIKTLNNAEGKNPSLLIPTQISDED
jgi:hypothetical protein